MMEMNKNIENTKVKYFIIIGLVIVLLIVCLFFIFNKKTPINTNVDKNTLDIKYEKGKEIELSNLKRGTVYTNNIVVSNKSDKDLKYEINWVDVSNTFVGQNKLLYKLDTHDPFAAYIGDSQIPISDFNLKEEVDIFKGDTHTYNFSIKFDGDEQKEKNNKFKGILEFKQIESNK